MPLVSLIIAMLVYNIVRLLGACPVGSMESTIFSCLRNLGFKASQDGEKPPPYQDGR